MTRPPDIIAFDRFWRAGHPMRPRTSKGRRWCMFVLLVVLSGLIGTYAYVTNSHRVRGMAERYLSQLLGGPVEVRRATLSMFEGLRLDDVKVHLASDSLNQPPIFSADTFIVRYSVRQLLAGRIEATEIIVRRPHVQLTQDLDALIRSYRRVVRDGPDGRPNDPSAPKPPAKRPPPLPQISLRDARVDYTETRPDGSTSFGTLALEGQFTPVVGGDRYSFSLQSRGMSDKLGPYVNGSIYPSQGRASAQLRNFSLDSDIRLMLPAPVRRWWEQHELSGQVEITDLTYALPRGDEEATFTVNTELQGVTLTVPPGELQGSDESRRVASVHQVIDTMTDVFRAAGYPDVGPLHPINELFTSAPLRLDNMSGAFAFTEKGIAMRDVRGDVEGNRIYIDGQIDGYPGLAGTMEPTARLRITSGDRPLTLPASPGYTNALPRAVREIYDQLRPQGACTLAVTVGRPSPGAKIAVTGAIDVLDGNFTFLRFPYPVRKATGQIAFKPADAAGPERLELNLSGYGIPGGPNEETVVRVSGMMGPLGADAGVGIRISSDRVVSEAALMAAFPAEVQRTFRMFDADGQGLLPTFTGKFTCDVNRAVGPYQPWLLFTHVTIDRGTAKLEAFPYPLEDMAVELKIGQSHVEIIDANMQRNGATLRVDGRVSWGAPPPPERYGQRRVKRPQAASTTVTELTVKASSVPIDHDLMNALPPASRGWLSDMGLAGRLDVTGTVRSGAIATNGAATAPAPAAGAATSRPPTTKPAEKLDYELLATLRDATVWPKGGAYVLGSVGGQLKLSPDAIELLDVQGTRGEATVKAVGTIALPAAAADGKTTAPPLAKVTVTAQNLALDAALYTTVPAVARRAWDQVRPRGTVDVEVVHDGPLGAAQPERGAPSMAATSSPPAAPKVTVKARDLSIHPKAFPYRLDHITGRVIVDRGRTTLHQITGRHDGGVLSAWGTTQTVGNNDVWDLTLYARNVTADEELLAALPAAMADTLRSIELKGKVGWYVPRFVHTTPTGAADPDKGNKGNVDLSGRISLNGASMNVGVPLSGVVGDVSGSATVIDGNLDRVRGTIRFDRLAMADRPARNVRATIDRPSGSDTLRFGGLSAELAGGNLAGDVALVTSPDEASRFTLDVVLRDADASVIAMDGLADVSGRLSASLGLEGQFDDPASRRGRGDVLVSGREMYNLPVVVGLLQITNLALPVNNPVTEATARYNVQGQRINFENISLRSKSLLMEGDGHLDFATKQVAMSFRTDNPTAFKIPFLSDLWRNAQQELFKIEVRGTIQDPKISNAALNTVTTTVDEVFRTGDRK
jgi:hypothetical protein